jgi:hypothetical protein
VDAGGVIRYTQVGFEQGDEKKYEQVIREVLSGQPGQAPGKQQP